MRNKMTLIYILLAGVLILTGCNQQPAEQPVKQPIEQPNITNQVDPNNQEPLSDENTLETEPLETEPLKTESGEISLLPSEGKMIESFIPSGWKLMDSVQLDFNDDGFMDVVGVLDVDGSSMTQDELYDFPRILFAIENIGDQHFQLSFQDTNLIRTQFEGGIFGDPYLSLSVEEGNFSTHAFGGSSWKWSEDNTYSFRNGEWYLIASDESYGQGPYITQYRQNDYDRRVGKRSYNSENDEIMRQRGQEWDSYDLEFDVALESPPKLKDFSAKSDRTKDRIKDKRVNKVIISDVLALSENQVNALEQKAANMEQICYTDLDYMAYTFKSDDGKFEYLAIYDRHSGLSTVVDQCERLEEDWLLKFDNVVIDQGRIYYNGYNSKRINDTDNEGELRTTDELAFTYLYSENLNGADKKILYEYENKADENGNYPYIAITFEIHDQKIILSTYSEQEIRYIRMNLDGSEVELLGCLKN